MKSKYYPKCEGLKMSKEFYQEVYNRMHIVSKDWGVTLAETRTKLKNADAMNFCYLEVSPEQQILARGFIQGALQSRLDYLPNPADKSESNFLKILTRFKHMELTEQLPSRNDLYSFVIDIQDLYILETNNLNVVEEIFDVLVSKSKDYGQAFRGIQFVGIRGRVWEKICRFVSQKAAGVNASQSESALDSLKDLLGYAIILLALSIE